VNRRRWWIHLVLIGGYFTAGIPLAFLHVPHRPALSSNPLGLLIVCTINIVLFSIVFALGWLASRASCEELLLRWRPGWWVVPLGIGYSVAIRFAVGIVLLMVICFLLGAGLLTRESVQQFLATNHPDVERLVDISALRNNSAYFWLTVTLASFVVAGLREEMWRAGTLAAMRALWPGTFGSRAGRFAGVALIAVVFGAAHLGMGALAAGLAGLLGLFLGVILIVHRSIWPAVIAHGLFDATTFALLPLAFEKLHHLR
jgi:membrane protease YdiL (CAAX protease family)